MYVSYQNLLVSQRVHTSAEKVPITELTAADRPTVEKRVCIQYIFELAVE